jgi:hypothetical protein
MVISIWLSVLINHFSSIGVFTQISSNYFIIIILPPPSTPPTPLTPTPPPPPHHHHHQKSIKILIVNHHRISSIPSIKQHSFIRIMSARRTGEEEEETKIEVQDIADSASIVRVFTGISDDIRLNHDVTSSDDSQSPNSTVKVSVEQQENTNEECQRTCMLWSSTVFVGFFFLPFIVCDIYWGFPHHDNTSCQYSKTGFDLNLAQWLRVDGISMICIYVFFILCAVASIHELIVIVFSTLFQCFSFAWLIVGSVMFWRDLAPSNLCYTDLSSYMWARLILGILSTLQLTCSNRSN